MSFWEIVWSLAKAFLVGGAICLVAEIVLLKTNITPARILVLLVVTGTVLGALGLYQPLIDFAGAGASVPLLGFGNTLARGAIEGVRTAGIYGAFSGGTVAAAGGIASAIFFGYLFAVLFTPKSKE